MQQPPRPSQPLGQPPRPVQQQTPPGNMPPHQQSQQHPQQHPQQQPPRPMMQQHPAMMHAQQQRPPQPFSPGQQGQPPYGQPPYGQPLQQRPPVQYQQPQQQRPPIPGNGPGQFRPPMQGQPQFQPPLPAQQQQQFQPPPLQPQQRPPMQPQQPPLQQLQQQQQPPQQQQQRAPTPPDVEGSAGGQSADAGVPPSGSMPAASGGRRRQYPSAIPAAGQHMQPPMPQPGVGQQAPQFNQQPGQLYGQPQQSIPQQFGQPQQPQQQQSMHQLTGQMGDMSMHAASSPAGVSLMGMPPPVHEVDFVPPVPQLSGQPLATARSPYTQCSPSFARSTMNAIPHTYALLSKSRVPLGLCIHPFKQPVDDELVPVIGPTTRRDQNQPVFGAPSIVRCRRCRAYINPFVQFVDNTNWRCNICQLLNDVPSFFDYDVQSQQYRDRFQRPEILHSVVEYIAPAEYTIRPPQPPVLVFVIDVSYAGTASGMLATFAKALSDSLDGIEDFEKRRLVAFITFDSTVHFYRIRAEAMEPEMIVMGDLDDPYLPLPDDVMVNISEHRQQIDTLLDKLPSMFSVGAAGASSALGAALQSAFKLLSSMGGKIVLLQASLPSLGPWALTPREEPKMLGTAAEGRLLEPAVASYKTFAIDCSRVHITVDMFLFGCTPYLDLATLTGAPRFTAGSCYYYPGFNAAVPEDSLKFAHELNHFLCRPMGLEAVLRIRPSRGLRVETYHGNFFARSSDLLALSTVSPDNAFTVQMTIEEQLTEPSVCIQSALLYTTHFGERRVRITTLALPVTKDLSTVYRSIDQVALVNLLSKMAIERALSAKLQDARDALMNKCVDLMGVFKASFLAAGQNPQLVAGENMKLLPLLILALLKHVALRGGSTVSSDARIAAFNMFRVLPVPLLKLFIHPRLYEIHAMAPEVGFPAAQQRDAASPSAHTTVTIVMPPVINLTSERMVRHGMYLMDTGDKLLFWVGRAVAPQIIQEIFDRPSFEALQSGKMSLPYLDTSLNQRVRNIVDKIREEPSRRFLYPQFHLVKEEDGDPMSKLTFLNYLVEDRHDFGPPYVAMLNEVRDRVNKGSF